MKSLLTIYLTLFSLVALSSQLDTENYIITITQNCTEGEVTCDKVTYNGVSKKNGNSIDLKGTTWHRFSADGTPGRFLGYKFQNGNIEYLVTETGNLSVIRNESEVLLEETGTWSW